ncbi:uncharacterized protein B0I36DRAFT_367616 [Microdochium trichocladiopsis]|uniref:Chromatin modification-related protein n=1 Tax=Microdochium trichocladiopsis TaxID=1682393 RepID=A0A9P8XY64_9PEZI|nr:uncharacterized protein B0I36DRAFT_367616 [Microdochium trichocladiopsis]KAH7021180.1 hypothetical protein B0I36DRAFT_367616 [Microdochium trichocladiopsis]
MKTAKPPPQQADPGATAAASRRAQPARQARANPTRTLSGLTSNSHESRRPPPSYDQPIDIFPAITHFTDAIQSLPKDLVRHFTLLKEVDAKIFGPEETLFQLVDAALKSNPPDTRRTNAGSSIVGTATPISTQHSIAPSVDDAFNQAVFDPTNIPRRQLFHQTAYKIQEMLNSLEEKNHVISTANDALSKQLSRINDVWPHLEAEFSDEAKWGSTTHWAYPSNRENNRVSQAERSRRDGAATITAAAQQLAEEAAARSDARKQAVAAKKSLKAAQQQQRHESDADDHETTSKSKSEAKKAASSKSRKGVDAAAAPAGSAAATAAAANGNPAPKKRKTEKPPANGGQPMERSLSSVFGDKSAKATKTSSPRGTPGPDQPPKKRKALPTANGAAKKSKTSSTAAATTTAAQASMSPATALSPALPNFLDTKAAPVKSPVPPPAAPAATARPSSSRARANSVRSTAESTTQQRPPSSASNKTNGTTIPAPISTTPVPPPVTNGIRPPIVEVKPTKEVAPPVKVEAAKEEPAKPSSRASSTADSSKKEGVPKAEESEPRTDATQQTPQTTASVVTTKSGRASKPSTPALGSFPDPVLPRSRNSRNQVTTTTAKRSHKKGASQMALAQAADDDAASSSVPDDDEDGEIDADEPLYCYCNNVSYGEMVACDAENCEKEWFHLGCVGLKAAPSQNTTWYCDNCKDRQKHGKKSNGR